MPLRNLPVLFKRFQSAVRGFDMRRAAAFTAYWTSTVLRQVIPSSRECPEGRGFARGTQFPPCLGILGIQHWRADVLRRDR